MRDDWLDDHVETLSAVSRPRRRDCLGCSGEFQSELSGERICPVVKARRPGAAERRLSLPAPAAGARPDRDPVLFKWLETFI